MNRSLFMRLVFLILIILICMAAMIFMAVERESGQETVPGSAVVPVIASFVQMETYICLSFLTQHKIEAG